MKESIKKIAASNVRHWLTVGAGFLVAKGIIDPETAEITVDSISNGITELVMGLVMFGFAQAWSLVEKFTKGKLTKPEEAPEEVPAPDAVKKEVE